MHEFSEKAKRVLPSRVKESLNILEIDPSIISLGAGEPDFPAPDHVIKFARKKLSESSHYSTFQGRLELRKEISKKLKKDNKIDANQDEIVVCCGSKEAILLTLLTLVNPGDEVIIPDPGYLGFGPIANVAGGTPVSLHLKEEDDFEINPDNLNRLVSEKTKVLILNTPSNPTGAVLKRKILEEIADIAIEKNFLVLSDEAYEKLIYDGEKHISIASLNGMKDHAVTTQTFSKAYAMCGFRIGYAAGPSDIIRKMIDLKVATTISASTVSQFAAFAALTGPQNYLKKMRKEYNRRRKMLIKRICEIPRLQCTNPKGAFYAFPNITELKMNSLEIVDYLLKKAKVMTIPGTEFGRYGEGFIRLSYATAYEKIEEALDRIEKSVKDLR